MGTNGSTGPGFEHSILSWTVSSPGDETCKRAHMTESLALIPSLAESQLNRNAAFRELREMVLNSVVSEHSKRNYAKALDEVFALCEGRKQPLSRALLMEYRAAMLQKGLSASTVNVRLSAVRKLIGEAQRNGIIGAEEAANLAGVPNLSQKGTRVGKGSRGSRPRNS
jgi:hypothetical protein